MSIKNKRSKILSCSINSQFENLSKGFTVVELLVIMPIVVLVIGGFVSAIVVMTGNVLTTRADNALVYDIQDALDKIETDVKASGGYLATNNFTIASPQGYNNNIEIFTSGLKDGYRQLILNSYATKDNPLSSNRTIITRKDITGVLMYNIVYFVKNNTLWRRVLMPSIYNDTTKVSEIPWQLPSCSPTLNFNVATFCKSKDMRLVDNIVVFSPSYYQPSDPNNGIASINQTDLSSATSVMVEISATRTTAGRTFTESGIVRTVSPNDNILPN